MFTLHASGIGSGIAIGAARIIRRAGQEIAEFSIASDRVEAEIARLQQAVERARASLQKIRDELPADVPEEIASFLGIVVLVNTDDDVIPCFGIIEELRIC